MTYLELKKEVGYLVGYGRDPSAWSTKEEEDIESCVLGGVRQFYNPPPISERDKAHQWTFLRPWTEMVLWHDEVVDDSITVDGVYDSDSDTTELTATSGSFYPSMRGRTITITDTGEFTIEDYTDDVTIEVDGDAECSGETFSVQSNGNYRLPDEFGGIVGDLIYFDSHSGHSPIVSRGQPYVRRRRSIASQSGVPTAFGVMPTGSPTVYDLMVYPEPDSAYTVTFRYRVKVSPLSDDSDEPHGSDRFPDVLQESCLAIAEERIMDGYNNVHQQKFMQRLVAAVHADHREGPRSFGYNGDQSDQEIYHTIHGDDSRIYVNGKHPSDY